MGTVLQRPFEKMGARLRVHPARPVQVGPGRVGFPGVSLDVRSDKDGEYFDLQVTGNPMVTVLEVRPEDRHLVLMTRTPDPTSPSHDLKSKFLCGHDERHWFVAAIPESAPVTTVKQAKESLKPAPVLQRQLAVGVREKEKQYRKNAAYKRQGEWFFLPVNVTPDKALVRKKEPFNRGRGKFHYAEEAYRTGGRTVYVKGQQILSPNEYNALTEKDRKAAQSFRIMNEGATLYVRGRITHADHKTLTLDGWHEVAMNEEHKSRAMGFVRFLD